jgi:signal transduction histidine kinase
MTRLSGSSGGKDKLGTSPSKAIAICAACSPPAHLPGRNFSALDKSGGTIWVTVAPAGDDDFSISVRDEGIGLPPGFDFRKAKGLGMRIINSFSQQLNGTRSVRVQNPGTEFIVTIPRQSSTLTPDQN